MKKTFLLTVLIVLLFNFYGCKQRPHNEAILEVIETPTGAGGTVQSPSSNKNKDIPYYYSQYKKLSAEQLKEIKILSKDEYYASYRFDPDSFGIPAIKNPLVYSRPSSPASYSNVMERVGTDGLVVAGYAEGERESYHLWKDSHTLTQFTVTDVYFGKVLSKSITVEEPYHLVIEKDCYAYFSYDETYDALKNGKKVLLYLKKDAETGRYKKVFDQIPLQEDYKDYSEDYLDHLLGFFRGEHAEYPDDKVSDSETAQPLTPDANGKLSFNTPAKIFYWPNRRTSNEELLAEMSDHVLVQSAVRYKIVIWPYGHKNYVGSTEIGDFHKLCMPEE